MLHRTQHQAFVHVVLRDAFLQNPARLVDEIDARGPSALVGLWGRGGALVCERQGREAELPPGGFAVTRHDLGRWTSYVVELPDQHEASDAHFVGLVVRKDPAPDGTRTGRFIVLEASTPTEQGGPRTLLAEWLPGRHVSLGHGPEPTRSAFVGALAARFAS